MSNLSSSSSITPTPSAFHNTPTATPTPTHPNSVYVLNRSQTGVPPGTDAMGPGGPSPPNQNQNQNRSRSRIPVTPAVLRSIFASSRTVLEERSLSRVAFFRFSGFLLSCLAISLAAARGRGIKGGAALLGVV